MTTLTEAYQRNNLQRAWAWIKSNPDGAYKSYCGKAYSKFALADSSQLEELRSELTRGIHEPAHATKLLLPKKSGILRPYTILTVQDQIVYQALVNIVAERLAPRIRRQYLRVSFGHMYSGKSSKWFYKSWEKGYAAFNKAARDAFERGLTFGASFDLTACYDSLDYEVLRHFLIELGCDIEFCEKLKSCLTVWTATNTRIYHSHGIPQGPLSSGLLSEVVLRHFDLNFGTRSNVRYLRYVDDIRLFASNEDALRRMLIKLDALSKDVGLFPQAGKINIHKIHDIEEELKSVSAPYASTEDGDDDQISDQSRIRKVIVSLTPRFKVEDNTRFKYLVSRAHPSAKLNNRLLRISSERPDLVPTVMRYFRKYDRLPSTIAANLLDRLSKEPLYDNTTAEIVLTLDQRMPFPFLRRGVRTIKRLWGRRNLGPDLRVATGRLLFRDGLVVGHRIRYALRTTRDWWVRSELYDVLSSSAHTTVFLENILNEGIRDPISDVALSAAARVAQIGINVKRPLKGLNRSAAQVLRQLRLISKLPGGVDGIERSFSRLTGRPTEVNWRTVFGRDYSQAEKQAIFCRALADTDVTAFVNAADVFNDLFLSRLYRHDPALGQYNLGSIGSVLMSPRLRTNYPATFALVSEIHEKRYVSNLSHAIARRTGKPTGRIKYRFRGQAIRLMRAAFGEIARTW
jgi:hypothetical protein